MICLGTVALFSRRMSLIQMCALFKRRVVSLFHFRDTSRSAKANQ